VNVLALNAGGRSLGYKLVCEEQSERCMKQGVIDGVSAEGARAAAVRVVTECLPLGIGAIGCRVAHGASRFAEAARVTPENLDAIRALGHLAPLHNPAEVRVIEAAASVAPDTPIIAVFDTAFHRTLPEVAWRYALPAEAGTDLRRYGFHGLAHHHASAELYFRLDKVPLGTRVISCHIGDGASVCAVKDGQSVDTSMGLTPLEGLVMPTRCGDLDAGVILELLRRGHTIADLEDMLYRRSGLLALSGSSGELEDLEPAAANGDPFATLALEVFAHRVRKYVGAYCAVLGGVDAVVLSGSLVEGWPDFRARILRGLDFLGIILDDTRNRTAQPHTAAVLNADTAPVPIWLIPTDEELQIVREVVVFLKGEAARFQGAPEA
jgi:acetate kinase